MTSRRVAVVAVVLITAAALLGAYGFRRPGRQAHVAASMPVSTAASAALRDAPMQPMRVATSYARGNEQPAPREDSLRGSAVDGAVNFDAAGRPRSDRELRRLFDYFLTRLGERDEAQVRDDVLAYLRDGLRLDAPAQSQVLAWFDAYVATGRATAELPRSGDPVIDAAQLQALHRARLGDALARAWFGEDDDYAAYTAQRLAIEHDGVLTAQDRAQRLSDLEGTLDPLQLEGMHAATDFQIAVAQSRELDASSADAAARLAERAALWGDDAALRLAALDQAESEWHRRAAAYARARAEILASSALAPSARDARLQSLLDGFTDPEQRRLLSLAQASVDWR